MAEDDIQRVLGRMEGKIDALITAQAASDRASIEKHKEHDARFEKHDRKINEIDAKLNRYGGALGVIMLGITLFGEKIRQVIFGS